MSTLPRPSPGRRRRASPRGFTLIEALVALVILASAGMALFSWINASIVSVRRVENANERNAAMANAIEYMQSINPMRTPAGRTTLGSYVIEWSSEPRGPASDGAGYPRGVSNFRVGLFDTRVRASRADDPAWFEFKLTLVGYLKVRESLGALP